MQQQAAYAKHFVSGFLVWCIIARLASFVSMQARHQIALAASRLTSPLRLLALVFVASLWAAPAWATCGPAEALSVASGGSVDITCHRSPNDFGFVEVRPGPFITPHGSVVQDSQFDNLFHYTNNGDGALVDVFTLTHDGGSPTTTFTVTVTPPASSIVISPVALNSMRVGVPFSQTLSASGGTAPYTFTTESGSIPGLTLSSSGVLSGIPTNRGATTLNVRATDSLGAFAVRAYNPNVAIAIVAIAPANTTAIINQPFSQTYTASGGIAPYTYQLAPGSPLPPPGLTLTGAPNSATLTGTPTVAGSYTFRIRTTESSTPGVLFQENDVTVLVTALPAPVANPVSAIVAFNSSANPITLNITGGAPDSVAVSTQPTSGTATASGTSITYTPNAGFSGSDSFAYTATNATGTSAPATVTITVSPPTIVVNPATIPGATVGAAYSQTFSGSGGTAPYTFSISAGAMPSGLSLNLDTGAFAGTPRVAGTFNFTVRATDSTGSGPFSGTRAYTLVVAAPTIVIAPATLPNGTAATAYSQTITASGGIGPYSFAVTGALPAGLSFNPVTGALTGTPTAGGTFNFTVTATSSSTGSGAPHTGSRAYALVIAAPTVNLPATTLANGTQGTAYSATLNPASGGTAPYSYAIAAGALPPGIALSAGGALSGTPTASGTFNFAVIATDSSTGSGPYSSAPRGYSLQIVNIPPVVNPVSAIVSHNSGANPITLNITGSVPTSVAIGTAPANGTAIASGTSITYQPTAGYAGADSFTYTATNGAGTSAPATVTITVTNPIITVSASGALTAQVGVPYTNTFTWTGGAQPFSSFGATGVPAGLAVTGTTANSLTVSGTPTVAGSFNFNVTATDSSTGNGPFTQGQTFTLTVSAPTLSMTPAPGNLAANYGVFSSRTFAASGGTGPYSFSLVAGSLPVGMSLVGGVLSGTPTVPGNYNIAIRATDSSTGAGAPFSLDQNYTIVVATPAVDIDPPTLTNPVIGEAYSATLTAVGGVAPYSFAVASGALPPGVSLAANLLSGTPTAAGTHNFTIRVTDTNGQTGLRDYSLTVAAPTLTMTPPAGTLTANYGVAYSQSFVASGGTAPYNYAITAGAVPAGLTLSGAGVLSGTPTVTGLFTFSVRAVDSSAGAGAPFVLIQNYVLQVSTPTITIDPPSLTNPVIGEVYSATLTANGGVAPYSLAVTAGALPPGVSFAANVLSGTPTAAGTYNFTITATDDNGQTGARTYSLTIGAPTLTMTPAPGTLTLPYGAAYSQTFAASGGTGPYSFSVASGGLPAGVSFAAGVLSGTPTVPGSYPVTIRVTDSSTGAGAPFNLDQDYVLDVPAPSIVIDPPTLANPVIGEAYSVTFTASGGVGTHSISLASGTLPDGMSFNAGVLSGTPTSAGVFALTIQATDANGLTASQVYNFTIAAPTLTMTPAPGTLTLPYGAAYSQTFAASGGTSPYSFSVASGGLPVGVSFAAGVLSGTPTVPGSYPVTIRVTDSSTGAGAPFSLDQDYVLDVPAPSIVIDPPTLADPVIGQAYSVTFTASGGAGTHTISLASGTLPDGMSFNAGVLSGTPTSAGAFALTIQATDANGLTASQVYNLTIAAPTLTMTPASGALAFAYGQSSSQTFETTGGIAPYSYTTTGALPAGVAFSSGVLSGTPTAPGTYSLTVTASDSSTGAGAPFTVTNNYTLQVDAPTISVTPATLPDGTVGQAYAQTLTGNGGVAPYTFSVVTGAVPTGLSLASAGALSGTPTAAGAFAFRVRATDNFGQTAEIDYSVDVIFNAPVASADNASTIAGQPVSIAVTDNDTGDISSIAVATAPANGTATVDGLNIVYTPLDTFSGTDTLTYVAVGPGGTSAPATVTIDVALRPDPTEDAEVMGILNAQTAATRRFANSQIGNFQQRMESMHDEGGEDPEDLGDGVTFLHGLSLSVSDKCTDAERVETNCGQPEPGKMSEMSYFNSPDRNDSIMPGRENAFAALDKTADMKRNRMTVWTGGVVNFGESEGEDGFEFTTTGVSAGVDYRFTRTLTLGAGLGYGRDDSDIGENGSTSDGESYTAAIYGSYQPNEHLFIDGLVGYQSLSFESERFVTQTGDFVSGERDGDQLFASLSVGGKFQVDQFNISPYGRLDVARATLDAFTESGDPQNALHYGEQDISTTTGTLGIRLNYSYVLPVGVFKPELRAEYQHDFEADSALTLSYADMLGGPFYRARIEGLDRDRFVLGLGASLEMENDLSMRLEYRGMFGSEGDTDHGFLLNLQKQF